MKGALALAAKWFLFLASLGYIAYKVSKDPGSFSTGLFTESLGFDHAFLSLMIILLLVPLNWGLESLKWRSLLRYGGIRMSLRESAKQVLCGVSLGVFTPNRVGEIAGKVMMADRENRAKVMALSLIGSICQFLATVTGLLLALGAITFFFNGQDERIDKLFADFSPVIGYTLAGILFCFLFVFYATRLFLSWTRNEFLSSFLGVVRGSARPCFTAYLLSVARYFVFLAQYWCVLHWFGIVDPDWKGFLLIPLIYFTSSAIPMFFPGDISVRGAAAIFFLEPVCLDMAAILYASVFIWVVNIGIPALAGSFFIFRLKLNSTGKQD